MIYENLNNDKIINFENFIQIEKDERAINDQYYIDIQFKGTILRLDYSEETLRDEEYDRIKKFVFKEVSCVK